MRVTIHNNADQTFWIFNFLDFLLFMCFWIFDTKQVKINQKQQTTKAFKQQKQ